MSSLFPDDHCPTCGGRVVVVNTEEGTSWMTRLSDRAQDVFVCPNDHVAPYVLVHVCDCGAQVLYVPHAVELDLLSRLADLKQNSDDADVASTQAAFWRERAIALGAGEHEFMDWLKERDS